MILVTGATGNVGSKVAKQLGERGVPFRAFVRDVTKASQVLGNDVEVVQGDFSAPDSIDRGLAGIDALFISCTGVPERAGSRAT
jgi:uncharacterized protein YbjT (DUF2867 family)